MLSNTVRTGQDISWAFTVTAALQRSICFFNLLTAVEPFPKSFFLSAITLRFKTDITHAPSVKLHTVLPAGVCHFGFWVFYNCIMHVYDVFIFSNKAVDDIHPSGRINLPNCLKRCFEWLLVVAAGKFLNALKPIGRLFENKQCLQAQSGMGCFDQNDKTGSNEVELEPKETFVLNVKKCPECSWDVVFTWTRQVLGNTWPWALTTKIEA